MPRYWLAIFWRAIGTALMWLSASVVTATEIYSTVDANGVVRYATQALSPSYVLLATEPVSGQIQRTPSKMGAATADATSLRPIIERIARRHGVSPTLVEGLIATESAYDALAISSKGARGAMQLMPSTAAQYGLTTPSAMHDPERNIDAGVRHLKALLVRHGGNVALALAAYNAGSGAVSKHGQRIPPYRETMLYVPAVLARAAAAGP